MFLKNHNPKTRDLIELSKTEQKRLGKLNGILDQLTRGKNVQNRQLQTWLNEDEYERFEAEWNEQLELREELKDKPKEIGLYEDKLKQAIFNYSRAEAYSTKRKSKTAQKFYRKSESLCESALETLQELLYFDPSIQIWFDRDLNFEAGGDLGLTPVAMPRVVTSRSLDKQNSNIRVISKREVKINIVEMAIRACGEIKIEDSQEQNEKETVNLRTFLDSLATD